MNAKYSLALILALQVSISLCEVQPPSEDLVRKYEAMKSVFIQRLKNVAQKIQDSASSMLDSVGNDDYSQVVKGYSDDFLAKPEYQAFVKVAKGLLVDVNPVVDKARSSVLGVYEHYLRPYIGTHLDSSINSAKVVLDKYMPAE